MRNLFILLAIALTVGACWPRGEEVVELEPVEVILEETIEEVE